MIEVFTGSLISGLLGVIISTVIYIKRENRMIKLDTIRKLASNRHNKNLLVGALNEVFVVFNDSTNVMEAFRSLHNEKINRRDGKKELLELFIQMCKDVSIKLEENDKDLFNVTFDIKKN